MKKIILSFIVLLLLPLVVNAKNDKVKVYIFEAGGCPFCEEEVNYLEGLESYNKTFEIVRKELYVDHINWAPGKDYETGVKVAKTFKAAGFDNSDYHATPFVVISDIYASAGYSTSLESIIEKAYKAGDKNIVKCIEDGKDECIKGIKTADLDEIEESADNNATGNARTYNTSSSSNDTAWVVIICTIIIVATFIIKSNKDTNKILNQFRG